jgi:hypothetical protein
MLARGPQCRGVCPPEPVPPKYGDKDRILEVIFGQEFDAIVEMRIATHQRIQREEKTMLWSKLYTAVAHIIVNHTRPVGPELCAESRWRHAIELT